MSKKEFLKELRSKLDILETSEIEDIITEYETHISDKMNEGKTETEAIKDFGDIDELAKEILSAYKIKTKPVEEDGITKFKNGADRIFDWIGEKFENVADYKTRDLGEIILLIFLGLLGMLVLRLPFVIFRDILVSISSTFANPINNFLRVIFHLLVEAGYLITIFIVFIIIIKKITNRSVGEVSHINTNEKKVKEKLEVIEEKESKKVVKDKTTTVGDVLYLLIRIFVCIMIFPFVFPYIISIIVFGVAISLAIKGIFLLGLILGLLGVIIAGAAFFNAIFRFVFMKKQYKLSLGSFIMGLILLGVGGTMFTFELIDFNYVNEAPKINVTNKTQVNTYDLGENTTIIVSNDDTPEIIYDSALTNQVRIENTYYDNFVYFNNYTSSENQKLIINNYNYRSGEYHNGLIKAFIKDLKKREIRNYERLFDVKTKIYINEADKDKLEIE